MFSNLALVRVAQVPLCEVQASTIAFIHFNVDIQDTDKFFTY